jgi:hypothetical protein
MKASVFLGATMACLIAATALADQPAQTLLFMTTKDWQRSRPEEKTALAADFMRVFCVRPAMSPARLAACLDGERGTPFDGALACVKRLAESGE